MKNSLLLHALAGAVAASQMALPFIDNAVIVAAVDPADPAFEVCSVANAKVSGCVRQAGGPSGLATADAKDFAKCACCQGARPVAAAYSTCSSYLVEAEPTLSAVYSAFSTLHSACGENIAVCGGSAVSRTEIADRVTTAMGSRPTDSIEPACHSVNNMYLSCATETPGFTDLPFGRQASCYCCSTTRGQVSWTDELDNYAKTCRDWARDVGSRSAFEGARSFATFCGKFSNACSPTSTLTLTEATATTSTDAEATGDATTTPGGSADQASPTASTAAVSSAVAAASTRLAGSAAGFVVVAAAMMAAI